MWIVRMEGPRGTGKTKRAIAEAKAVAAEGGRVMIVTDSSRAVVRRKLRNFRREARERIEVAEVNDDLPIPPELWDRIESFDGLVVLDGTYGP